MGEGLTKIAEAMGGMRVSARGEICDYVALKSDCLIVIAKREKAGWRYIGPTPDNKFMRFMMRTEEVDRRKL